MDNDDAVAAQQMMCSFSDRPGQFRQDPMQALINQAHRARNGQGDGMDYLHIPF
jgi:hypothetical protein